jgi:hypothetical protein
VTNLRSLVIAFITRCAGRKAKVDFTLPYTIMATN